MNAYPDTSFLFSLYVKDAHSERAAKTFQAMKEPLHVTSLNRFELVAAIQLSIFRKVIAAKNGQAAFAAIDEDIATGALVVVSCDWAAVHGRAMQIAMQHTARDGSRSFDILHVATALELGASLLLTFDAQQIALARTVGLKEKP